MKSGIGSIIGIISDTWLPVKRGLILPGAIEKSFLQLETRNTILGGEELEVWFYDEELSPAGSLSVYFDSSSSVRYKLGDCMSNYTSAASVCPSSEGNKTWIISKDGHSVKAYCNGKTIIDITASVKMCENATGWATVYDREVTAIYFPDKNDSATVLYFVGKKHLF